MTRPNPDLLRELATQRERIEELEAEVAFLREQLNPDTAYAVAALLGIPQWLVPALQLFVIRQIVPRDVLMAIGDDLEWGTSDKYHHVAVCRLRKRLNPYGIHIETMWGFGYRIGADHQAKLKALLN